MDKLQIYRVIEMDPPHRGSDFGAYTPDAALELSGVSIEGITSEVLAPRVTKFSLGPVSWLVVQIREA